MCLFVCLSECVRKKSEIIVLNGGEYDIGWDYDRDYDDYSLKFIF